MHSCFDSYSGFSLQAFKFQFQNREWRESETFWDWRLDPWPVRRDREWVWWPDVNTQQPWPVNANGRDWSGSGAACRVDLQSDWVMVEWRIQGVDPVLGCSRSIDWVTIFANQLRLQLASFSAAVAVCGGRMKLASWTVRVCLLRVVSDGGRKAWMGVGWLLVLDSLSAGSVVCVWQWGFVRPWGRECLSDSEGLWVVTLLLFFSLWITELLRWIVWTEY